MTLLSQKPPPAESQFTKASLLFMTETPIPLVRFYFFRPSRKVQYLTEHWNKLGEEGWEFVRDGYNCLIFKRIVEEES